MKYTNKRTKKLVRNLSHEGDEFSDPLKRVEKVLNKSLTSLSKGGHIERSHSKRVGDIVNKNIESRYSAVDKALKRISNGRTT